MNNYLDSKISRQINDKTKLILVYRSTTTIPE